MLDICFENAHGIWCALWWDDCVYHKDYLETMLKETAPSTLVLLRYKTLFDKNLNKASTTENPRILCAMFQRSRHINFAQELSPQFETVKILDNDPELLTKVVRLLCL